MTRMADRRRPGRREFDCTSPAPTGPPDEWRQRLAKTLGLTG